eukprot:401905-Ditylum_brightwellii.AAC.1
MQEKTERKLVFEITLNSKIYANKILTLECGIIALSPSADPLLRLVELIQFAAAVSAGSYKGAKSDAVEDMLIGLLLSSSSSVVSSFSSFSSGGGKKKVEPVLLQSSVQVLSLH